MVSEINQNMLKREKTLKYFKIYVKNMLKNKLIFKNARKTEDLKQEKAKS